MKRIPAVCIALIALALPFHVAEAVDYFVDDTSGGGDGLSWGAAFQTIQEALNALAATNPPTGWSGGHTITVTNGSYTESLVINTNHNGALGAPNVIQGVGGVEIDADGSSPGFEFDGDGPSDRVTDITLDGFVVRTGRSYGQIEFDDCERIIMKNCATYDSDAVGYGVYVNSDSSIDITNCVVFGGCYAGLRVQNSTCDVTVRNCIFVGNANYGIDVQNTAQCTVYNSCIYGNVRGGLNYEGGGTYTTDADVSTDTQDGNLAFTNCVARNPGFAHMMGNYRFNAYYQNSPGHNGGENGIGMGPLNDRVIVPTSSKTYYVRTDGNDTNTGEGSGAGEAWQTLSHAADNAVAGDTVIVMAGTYEEELWITNGASYQKPLVYRADGDVVIHNVDGPIRLRGVADVVVDGFSVTGNVFGVDLRYCFMNTVTNVDAVGGNGTDEAAASFFCAPKNTLVDCDLHDSEIGIDNGDRGGIYDMGGNVVNRCRVYDNDSYGVTTHARWNRFERCEIFNNGYSGIEYGHCHDASPGLLVYSCNIYSNGFSAPAWPNPSDFDDDRQHGICENHYGNMRIYNSTVYGNAYAGLSIGIFDAFVYNCIFAGNRGCGVQEGPNYSGTPEDVIAKNCLFWDNGADYGSTDRHFLDMTGSSTWPDITTNVLSTTQEINNAPNEIGESNSGNVVADPLFIDVATGDYRVKGGSPVIDAGEASLVPTDYFPDQNEDVYSNPRLKLTAVDIGAAEWQPWSGTILLIK